MGKRIGVLNLLLCIGIGTTAASCTPDPEAGDVALDEMDRVIRNLENRIKVEVLNGGGVPGVAQKATEFLRDQGFDVVFYGNAGTYSEDSSVVMDRGGRGDQAAMVAEALGISKVLREPDSTLFVDVTVRLGRDWSRPTTQRTGVPETRPWWDPRRYFGRGTHSDPDHPIGP